MALKDDILSQATTLFNQWGLKTVTMDQLAQSLAISKKTLYQEYKTKGELVQAAVNRHFETVQAAMRSILVKNINAIDKLFEVDFQVCEIVRRHDPTIQFQLKRYYPEVYDSLRQQRQNVLLEHATRNMVQGQAEELYRPDLDRDLLAMLYFNRVEFLVSKEELCDNQPELQANLLKLLEYHIRGMATPEGLSYLNEKLSTLQIHEKSI